MTNFGNAQQRTELYPPPAPPTENGNKLAARPSQGAKESALPPQEDQREKDGEVKVHKRAMPRQKLPNVSEVQSTQAKLSPKPLPLRERASALFGSFSRGLPPWEGRGCGNFPLTLHYAQGLFRQG